MHPSSLCSLMIRLGPAVGFGLLTTAATLAWPTAVHTTTANSSPKTISHTENDRGSGRFNRLPALNSPLGYRGSGRIEPTPPPPQFHAPLAHRGSGRIAYPLAT